MRAATLAHHQEEHAGRDRQVAPTGLRHYRFERAGAMAHKHLPASRIGSGTTASRSTAASARSGRTAEDLVVGGVEQADRCVGAGSHLRSRIGLVDDQRGTLPAQDFHLVFEGSARLQMALQKFGQQDIADILRVYIENAGKGTLLARIRVGRRAWEIGRPGGRRPFPDLLEEAEIRAAAASATASCFPNAS